MLHVTAVFNTFLSTPSARRATHSLRELLQIGIISIHALREEGDDRAEEIRAAFNEFLSTPSARRATLFITMNSYSSLDFYPRPPRGGRHAKVAGGGKATAFLSTPSARRATFLLQYVLNS